MVMAGNKWSESKSVGIDEIDDQHQKLCMTIQKLEDSIRKGQSHNDLKEVFEQLADYIDFHFKSEERILKLPSTLK